MTKETELDPLDILKKSKARYLHSFRKALDGLNKNLQEESSKIELQAGTTQLKEKWMNLKKIYDDMFQHMDRMQDDKNIEALSTVTWEERDDAENEFLRLLTITTQIIDGNKNTPKSTPKPSRENSPARSRNSSPEKETRQLELPKLVPQQFNCDISKRTSFGKPQERHK